MDISYIPNTVKDAYRNLQWTSLIYQTQSWTHTETFNGHLLYTKHSQGHIEKPSMDISFVTNTVRDAYGNLQMDISYIPNTVKDTYRNIQWTSLI